MNPKPPPRTPDPPISQSDFQKFLTEANAVSACELCRTNDWMVIGDESDKIPAVPVANAAGALITGNIPIISLVCRRCGHLRMFARKIVTRWLEGNRA